MECSEAALPETCKFVLGGLLSAEDGVHGHTRAFHIIEVEMSFLYDFFTKYGALFLMEISFLVMAVLKMVFISIFLVVDFPEVKTCDPMIYVAAREVDVTITVVVMGALLLAEVPQAIFYLASDLATISLACSYPRRGTCKFGPLILWFLKKI